MEIRECFECDGTGIIKYCYNDKKEIVDIILCDECQGDGIIVIGKIVAEGTITDE